MNINSPLQKKKKRAYLDLGRPGLGGARPAFYFEKGCGVAADESVIYPVTTCSHLQTTAGVNTG